MAMQNGTGPLEDLYVIDTGCSQHSICRREDFVSIQSYNGKPLSGIGNTKIVPKGVGTAKLTCNVGGRPVLMLLPDVLFCPDMGVNLISITQLLQAGAKASFELDKARIIHGGKTYTATQRAGLFILDLWSHHHHHPPSSAALVSYSIANPYMWIWHERTAHLGKKIFTS